MNFVDILYLYCVSFVDVVKYMLRKIHRVKILKYDMLEGLCDSEEDTSELISFDKLDCFLIYLKCEI